jgi:hypothetical protein
MHNIAKRIFGARAKHLIFEKPSEPTHHLLAYFAMNSPDMPHASNRKSSDLGVKFLTEAAQKSAF